jgi:glycosyltransferase involved in cell wall biosynthesis
VCILASLIRKSPSKAFDSLEAPRAVSTVKGRAKLRVLVASHSHPEITKGGAEIAAFQLYRGIASRTDCAAWFLGCDGRQARSDIPISQPFGTQDFLYSGGEFDWLKFANRDPRFPEAFTDLLMELSPDVVHFHHYSRVGVEAFWHVKQALPDAKIVVTLHEYLAICNHYGQMVTRPHQNLCYHSTPARCVECFQELQESDFFLRKRYIQHFFDFVDHFISPSQFLADRYIEWGIGEDRISLIENAVRAATNGGDVPGPASNGPLRVGFFGQLSSLKGADVLLEAARLLDKEGRKDICFDIFGNYRNQPPEFQQKLMERMELVGLNVGVHGPYDEVRVDGLMRSVDVVIVPSVWWENSPLVIQEAFRNGRPVICSDIGGMVEKVRNGIDGFHFHAGSANDLALLLKRLADDRQILIDVVGTVRKPPTSDVVIDAHLTLYQELLVPKPRDDYVSSGPRV